MKAQLDLFSTPLPAPTPDQKPKPFKPFEKPVQKIIENPIVIIDDEDEIPKKILISSDDSEVEFIRMTKDGLYVYKYTKGLEKIGMEVSWTDTYIKSQLKNYFRKK